jgi:hypothetical protein
VSLVLGIALLWKGGTRGRILVLFNGVDSRPGGHVRDQHDQTRAFASTPFSGNRRCEIARRLWQEREHAVVAYSHVFAATLMAYVFYRRTNYVMLPLALTMAFSRGVRRRALSERRGRGRNSSGMGYAAAGLVLTQLLWRRLGPMLAPRMV